LLPVASLYLGLERQLGHCPEDGALGKQGKGIELAPSFRSPLDGIAATHWSPGQPVIGLEP